MPTRILRDGIIDSDRVNQLTWGGEVFYRRLMSVADDFGRFDARPSILRSRCYPLKLSTVTESKIGRWVEEATGAGLIRLYAVNGKQFGEIVGFGQRHRTAPKYPDPPPIGGNLPQSASLDEAEAEGAGAGAGEAEGAGRSTSGEDVSGGASVSVSEDWRGQTWSQAHTILRDKLNLYIAPPTGSKEQQASDRTTARKVTLLVMAGWLGPATDAAAWCAQKAKEYATTARKPAARFLAEFKKRLREYGHSWPTETAP